MTYGIFTRTDTGAWNLQSTEDDRDKAIKVYSDTIKYMRIEDVLLTENLQYTVIYDSSTGNYTADYPDPDQGQEGNDNDIQG